MHTKVGGSAIRRPSLRPLTSVPTRSCSGVNYESCVRGPLGGPFPVQPVDEGGHADRKISAHPAILSARVLQYAPGYTWRTRCPEFETRRSDGRKAPQAGPSLRRNEDRDPNAIPVQGRRGCVAGTRRQPRPVPPSPSNARRGRSQVDSRSRAGLRGNGSVRGLCGPARRTWRAR